jgi:hypothetical protein
MKLKKYKLRKRWKYNRFYSPIELKNKHKFKEKKKKKKGKLPNLRLISKTCNP